jgi:D-alanyl-D-alanine carboxypeptidase/D-alanyl-D-alanine-endopeptidase (penicillin-binding protein 4)
MLRFARRLLWMLVLAAAPLAAQELPPDIDALLARAQVPREALHIVVQPVDGGTPRLVHSADTPVNPASLMKLVTTYAALDLLGPAWTWKTPVWLAGPIHKGVLDGALVIKGSGDPKLVHERLWLWLKRVRQLGVDEIRGDIVLDNSAFAPTTAGAADFDNEPLRPYNVQPEALLFNHKAVIYGFVPDPLRGVAVVLPQPALAGVKIDRTVPLVPGPCNDWRHTLKATLDDPRHARFAGSYPLDCGERSWPVAYADPASYNARLVEALWRELGGRLGGRVREGTAPATSPSFELVSPPLGEVVRDINKFSNNVMAQQLFLTLGLQGRNSGTPEAARQVLLEWLAARGQLTEGLVIDNGSGLSRHTRVPVKMLAQVLQQAWASPVMPELMASLPVTGLDGTLRRSRADAGRAHLKTGSLRDVTGVAGYVLTASGRRQVLVAVIRHPDTRAARDTLDALVQWTLDDVPRSCCPLPNGSATPPPR